MRPMQPHPTARKSIFPGTMFFAFLFIIAGGVLLFTKIAPDSISFIPEDPLVYISAIGSTIGGIYMIYRKLWRPRIYV